MYQFSAGLLLLLSSWPKVAYSLSSHSPQDLFASPKYSVQLSHLAVQNESVADILLQRQSDGDTFSTKHHLIRNHLNQAFLCSVPTFAAPEAPVALSEDDLALKKVEREKGLERGLNLIESMKGGCLYQRQGWFTYSFCYGSEIRQFHAIHLTSSSGPSEDPATESYTLGQSPAPSTPDPHPKYGSGSALAAQEVRRIPGELGGGNGMGLGWDVGGRYLTQKWEGGTLCDKTDFRRSVEVQFHCSTQSTDRIALIRETSTCEYLFIIHTPRLCAEPVFLDGRDDSRSPSNIIDCRPVNDAETIDGSDRKLTDEEVEGRSIIISSRKLESRSSLLPSTPLKISNPVAPIMDEASVVIVYDVNTGKIHSATSARGEDLIKLTKEGRGEKGGQTVESVEGLKDVVKNMQQSIIDALENTDGAESFSDDYTEREDSVMLEGLDGLMEAINRRIKAEQDGISTGEEDEGEGGGGRSIPLEALLERLREGRQWEMEVEEEERYLDEAEKGGKAKEKVVVEVVVVVEPASGEKEERERKRDEL